MATAFEPRLSASINRAPMAPAAISMADTLPTVDFGFDKLRKRMADLTAHFDAFIEQGRKSVLEERNKFHVNIAELQEDQRMKKKDIEILQLKAATHQQTVAKEAAEAREMQAQIMQYSTQRDHHAAARDALKTQIASMRADIAARAAAQRAYAERLDAQARFNVPELDFWVTGLGLRIEGAGQDDRLRFVFTHLDERDWEREAWFELSTAGRDYDVRHARPKLEREKVERVLERVNETRELAVLLKGMRELFVEAMKAS